MEPTNVAPERYSKRSGIASATAASVSSGVCAADVGRRARRTAVRRLALGLQQVLARLRPVVLGVDRLPALVRVDLLLDRGHPHPRLDAEPLVRLGDPELDHLGAEVVAVLVQARLRLDPEAEVVDRLVARRRGLDAQHVEVVAHRLGVLIARRVGDLEPHSATTCGWVAAPPK